MKVSEIFNIIAKLSEEKKLALISKLFEKKIISNKLIEEAYKRSNIFDRYVKAYKEFLSKGQHKEEQNEKATYTFLSDLCFIPYISFEKIFVTDYRTNERYVPSFADIMFLGDYHFTFFNQNENLMTERMVTELLTIFSKANKLIKISKQTFISKTKFYKLKNIFIKFLIKNNLAPYKWHIERKENTDEVFIAIVFNMQKDFIFHQKSDMLNDISLSLDCQTTPEVYKNSFSKTDYSFSEKEIKETIILVKLFYYKFIERFSAVNNDIYC